MLDAAFERPPGDVVNAGSWPFPVLFQIVAGATAGRIVGGDDRDLLDDFIAAGESLRAAGAVGLVTSCGFLAGSQSELASRLTLPIATSALLQIPLVERTLPAGRRVGVVTYDAELLGERHFRGVGADPGTPTVGLPRGGHFHSLIEGCALYRRKELEAEAHESVARLLADHAGIGAIVFECTNLPPFAKGVEEGFGLPVFDVITLGCWLRQGLVRHGF